MGVFTFSQNSIAKPFELMGPPPLVTMNNGTVVDSLISWERKGSCMERDPSHKKKGSRDIPAAMLKDTQEDRDI